MKKWLRISSTEDERWNVFTWLVLIVLCGLFGTLAEYLFGSWSWALNMVGLGLGAVEDVAHLGSRSTRQVAGGVGLVVWLCLLVPMVLTGLPAFASLLGLSVVCNPRRDDSDQ